MDDLFEDITLASKNLKERLIAVYVAKKKLSEVQDLIKSKNYPIDEFGEIKLGLLNTSEKSVPEKKADDPILKAIKGE